MLTINQWLALLLFIVAVPFFACWMAHNRRVWREAARWNNATTPEEIQALLPPGHRYDPETRLCHYPEDGACPYRRGQKVVHV